jgi:nucleotide-binding universal stress UspA family protein
MTYASLLVHVDHDKRSPARVDLAARLATSWNAHLTGLHVIPQLHVPGTARAELGQEFFDRQAKRESERVDRLGKEFADAMRRHGIAASDWRAVRGDVQDVIPMHARYADLVIVGQRDPDDEAGTVRHDFPELVAVTACRPVLIVPYAGAFDSIGKHVLVCWDAGAPATRAVTAAMPLLERAGKVTVITVNAKPSAYGHGDLPGADLALYLARHKIKAEVSAHQGIDIGVGEFLLSRAADFEVDLIVMGAYGHARMREMAFGGCTRTIMQHMTVPVVTMG